MHRAQEGVKDSLKNSSFVAGRGDPRGRIGGPQTVEEATACIANVTTAAAAVPSSHSREVAPHAHSIEA
jgi:hypothetical protein|eukprot:COSAG02_NODE_1237_length_13725_cov_27.071921_12_plen_69_part_00